MKIKQRRRDAKVQALTPRSSDPKIFRTGKPVESGHPRWTQYPCVLGCGFPIVAPKIRPKVRGEFDKERRTNSPEKHIYGGHRLAVAHASTKNYHIPMTRPEEEES